MFEAARSVASLLVGVALLMIAGGALGTVVGFRLSVAGAGAGAIGLVTAFYYLGLTGGSLYAHRLIGRVGHIRAFSAFASVLSAAALSHALDVDVALWSALRFFEGFCLAGLYMCIESWLNDRATNRTRGQLLSLYMVTLYGAMAVGQQLLHLSDESGALVFMATSILLSLALVPVALTRMAPPVLPDVASFSFRRLYAASPLGIVGVFVSGAVSGAIFGLGPVFADRSGYGASGTALFMTLLILGGVVLQWPIGKLSDRYDRRTVIIAMSGGLALMGLAMILAALELRFALPVVAVLFGGLSFALYPVCAAHTNDHIDRRDIVAASGGLILASSVGAIIGPLAASGFMSLGGPWALFLFTSLAALAAMLFGLWRTRVRPPLPAEARGPFQALPITTPAVGPLDPRREGEDPPRAVSGGAA